MLCIIVICNSDATEHSKLCPSNTFKYPSKVCYDLTIVTCTHHSTYLYIPQHLVAGKKSQKFHAAAVSSNSLKRRFFSIRFSCVHVYSCNLTSLLIIYSWDLLLQALFPFVQMSRNEPSLAVAETGLSSYYATHPLLLQTLMLFRAKLLDWKNSHILTFKNIPNEK